MSRLFITQREIDFINDIAKEVVKDVAGQKICYFPISEIKTQTHEIYNEAVKKIYDNPIEVDALVADYEQTSKITNFGVDNNYTIEAYIHYKDLIDKAINVCIGDFFSFGELFFEITQVVNMKSIYGQPEHRTGVKINGTQVREGLFKAKLFGPTDIRFSDEDAVKLEFEQQRGQEFDSTGRETGDIRDLQKKGVLDSPITGAKSILKDDKQRASFYDDE